MSGFYFRLSAVLLALLLLPALLIRAQPADDHSLRAVLLPENCTPPCFLGVQPGRSTLDEAVAILEEHAWVDKVVRQGTEVYWFWNGQQPAFLDGIGSPSLSALIMNGEGTKVVGAMNIPTRLPAGMVYLVMGVPLSYRLERYNQSLAITSSPFAYLSMYFRNFSIGAPLACPPRLESFWQRNVMITLLGNDVLYEYWTGWDRMLLHKSLYHNLDC